MWYETFNIPGWAVGGGSAGLTFYMAKWIVTFLTARFDKRQEVLDAGTEKLIEQLQEQVKGLLERAERTDEALEECRQHRADDRREMMELRGIIQGKGIIANEAQKVIALEKKEGTG